MYSCNTPHPIDQLLRRMSGTEVHKGVFFNFELSIGYITYGVVM